MRVSWALSARDLNIRSEMILRMPLRGVSVITPSAGKEEARSTPAARSALAARSAAVIRPPKPVPAAGTVPWQAALAAAVRSGLFCRTAITSRSIILPPGPEPIGSTFSKDKAYFAARFLARGEMAIPEFTSRIESEIRGAEAQREEELRG